MTHCWNSSVHQIWKFHRIVTETFDCCQFHQMQHLQEPCSFDMCKNACKFLYLQTFWQRFGWRWCRGRLWMKNSFFSLYHSHWRSSKWIDLYFFNNRGVILHIFQFLMGFSKCLIPGYKFVFDKKRHPQKIVHRILYVHEIIIVSWEKVAYYHYLSNDI